MMKRTLRVGLFVGTVACAVAASALMVRAGGAAGVGVDNAARRAQTGAQAAASPTPRSPATPQGSATPQRDERLWQRAMAIHRRAIIVDGHNDIPTIMVDENYDIGTPSAGKYHTDRQRLKRSG